MVFNFLKSSYDRIATALAKTRALLGSKLRTLFSGSLSADKLEALEEILYESDLGVETATELTAKLKEAYRQDPTLDSEGLIALLHAELLAILKKQPTSLKEIAVDQGPTVILIVGVNGSGKTTSVAKLGHLLQKEGKKVVLAAADTFRAAAMEQLEVWAHRLGIDVVKGHSKADPAAVAYDAVTAGKSRQADFVLVDTAGRLHTKTPLMQELEKVKRSCAKVVPNAPHETLLILDASIGQNALDQIKTFHAFTPITGIILTKMDGTAKGGIAIAIQKKFGVPIKFIGTGEGMEDLVAFDPDAFVAALFV